MKLSVIGVGYLGAVHAAAMASLGHDVVGLDIDEARIDSLNAGKAPFFEPGFQELLEVGLESGKLAFSTSFDDVADCDVHFLALGTPQRADGTGADLTYLNSAIDSLIKVLPARGGQRTLIAGKSTVPVGTARELANRISGIEGAILAWNPEFLREGFAVKDTLSPDRLVYGVADERAALKRKKQLDDPSRWAAVTLDTVYADLRKKRIPRKIYNFETAELVKVSANAFLATKISFINAIAEVCEVSGADVTHVAEAMGFDDRIGKKFLRAGIGFGGGCLPKDIRGFMARAEEMGVGHSLAFLREVDKINERRRRRPAEIALRHFGGHGQAGSGAGTLAGHKITVLGAAFKPDSDDIRDSPALDIAQELLGLGANVTVTDPQALELVKLRRPHIHVEADLDEALRGAEMLVLGTEWREYKKLDPVRTAELVADPVIIDGRGVLDPYEWREAGWKVYALGRP